jgi:hypothetical protein
MQHIMTKRLLALAVGLGLAATACKDSPSVTDLNNVSAEALAAGLTRSSTQLLVTGLLNASRTELGSRYLVFTETLGRDFYRLDNAENRYINELVGPFPADYSAFTGGGAFTDMYVTVRAGNNLLTALPSASGLTAAEVKATSGFVKTIQALAFYRAIETRDSLGIAVDVNHAINDPPAKFVCKPNALAFISTLLDDAAADLAAGGASFPFVLPSGFTTNGTFNTPATFLQVNRGLKGKVELYRGLSRQKPNAASIAAAVTALNASFASPTASMATGIYNTYSTAANETANPLADQNIYLNPFVGDSIKAGDLRAAKIITVTSKTLNGVTSKYKTTRTDPAAALTLPIAIMKNAELLLLRAQAYIEQGNYVLAYQDINAVRTNDGGLPALVVQLNKTQAIKDVLYEKRYSLLGESGQRIVDLRAYGFIAPSAVVAGVWVNGGVTGGPGSTAGDIFQTTLPIPKVQLDTRNIFAPATITLDCP